MNGDKSTVSVAPDARNAAILSVVPAITWQSTDRPKRSASPASTTPTLDPGSTTYSVEGRGKISNTDEGRHINRLLAHVSREEKGVHKQ